jgi:hypothetical protein
MDVDIDSDWDVDDVEDVDDLPEDFCEYAYGIVSSNPLRKILSGKRWTKERVEEVRGRLSNFEEYFSYFCRLVDFPSCYERKKKRFIKCHCLKNLDYDEVQVAAGAMGELLRPLLLRPLFVYCRFFLIFFCLSF